MTYTYPPRTLLVDTTPPSAPLDVAVTRDVQNAGPDEDPSGPWRVSWKPATDLGGSRVKGYWVTVTDAKDPNPAQTPAARVFVPGDTLTNVYEGQSPEVPEFIVQAEDKQVEGWWGRR